MGLLGRPQLAAQVVQHSCGTVPQPGGPSPVVAVQTSPWLSRTPSGISGCTRGMWSLISFSSSSSSMQTSPSTASPTLQTDAGHHPAWPAASASWPAGATSAAELLLSTALFAFSPEIYFHACFKTQQVRRPVQDWESRPRSRKLRHQRKFSRSSLGYTCLVCSRRFTDSLRCTLPSRPLFPLPPGG